MRKPSEKNAYNPGDVVYAKAHPTLRLVVRRYVDRVYYCTNIDNPEDKERVYFERELIEDAVLDEENNLKGKKKRS